MKIESSRIYVGNIVKHHDKKDILVRSNTILIKFANYYLPLFMVKRGIELSGYKSRIVKDYGGEEVGIYNLDKKFLKTTCYEPYNSKTGYFEYFPYKVKDVKPVKIEEERVSYKRLLEIQNSFDQVEDLSENLEEIMR